jgi:hypothetical protein
MTMDRRSQLRDLYGFDFPDDLFAFWEFAKHLRPLDPLHALSDALHATLVGPFDVLYGLFDGRTPRYSPLLHWRYYLDPPEFFTVLVGGVDGLHWGYVLDDPGKGEAWVAHYYAEDDYEIEVDGATLFEAVRLWLEYLQAERELDLRDGLLAEADVRTELLAIDRVRRVLVRHATGQRKQTGAAYADRYGRRSSRRKRIVARTRDRLGIIVPAEQYRPLSLSNRDLRQLLRKGDATAVIAEGRRALEEGFPGTALHLGREMWAQVPTGPRLDEMRTLLDDAYKALGREVLREVLGQHLTHRDRPYLDVLHQEDGNGAVN